MLRKLFTTSVFAAGVLGSAGVYAQAPSTPDCAAKATEKKLHGAALNSFMKKCERDAATSACDAAAVEKQLAGAARTSFTKKCIKGATTTPPAQ
jgi:membrane-bound lytic murein transglycosylase B